MLPMALLLSSCGKETEKEPVQEEAQELLTLANSVVGKSYANAKQTILDQHFTEISADTFKLEKDNMEYLVLDVEGGIVVGVEAGKDHSNQDDAKTCLKTWSNTAYAKTLPDVSFWGGQIDTTLYTDGIDKSKLSAVVGLLLIAQSSGMLPIELPKEQIDRLSRAFDKSRANYLADLETTSSETIQEVGMYSKELDDMKLEFTPDGMEKIMELLGDGLNVEGYWLEMNRQHVSPKQEVIRVVYHRMNEVEFDFTEM